MFAVTLKQSEWDAAASLGLKREALRKSRGVVQDFSTDRGGSLDKRNAIGSVAEYALAKHYGLQRKWCETQAFSLEHWTITSDVGHTLQVRASDNAAATLWVREEDAKYRDCPFILARVAGPKLTVTFVGWVWGRDAMTPANWDRLGWSRHGHNRAAFNVPNTDLIDMALLPEECIYEPAVPGS